MRRITLLKDGWFFSCASWLKPPSKLACSTHEWRSARVPGSVHLDLVEQGIIADPFLSCHELGCQWVDGEDWYYRHEFDFTPDSALPRRILRFEGLDTVCRIYLNDAIVAAHDNHFVPLEVDVSDQLLSGKNQLRIEFDAATRVGEERRASYFKAHGLKPDTVRMDARAFVRKAQYMYGWDWGPSLISCGIDRPAMLVEYEARILDVHVEQRHNEDGSVEVRCRSEIEQSIAVAGALEIYHFLEGFAEPLSDGEWRKIEQPRLWWPHGMGRPELYELVSILGVGCPRSHQDTATARDVRAQRIGLRKVALVREPDVHGESFRFVVGGRELYAMGANWIPDDNFTARVDRERLRAQLERALDLGMNMLRVWGGGFYETPDFYELCDELGILVWQDFPYACSYYPDDAAACDAARHEAQANVRRLRNHPSLAIWCGNNENDTMRDSGWEGAARHPARYEGDRIYREVLPAVLAELDSERPYIPSSPCGVGRANDGGNGDQHYWDVWHGRGDYRHYLDSTARFCSEFGFASAPGHSTWLTLEPRRNLLPCDVRDPVARWHDKTSKGYETFLGFVEQHYPVSQTIEQWTYYSQLNQRDALRFGIEHYRRSQTCRGTLIWQLNDCWPVQSWAVVDSAFHYKAAAFDLRRLYAPLLGSLERVGDSVRLWGVFDNGEEPRSALFRLEVRSLGDGALLHEHNLEVTLKPGERRILGDVAIDPAWGKGAVVTVSVDSQRSFVLLCEPKELDLTAPRLTAKARDGLLTVKVPCPVVDLCVWDPRGEVIFLDNFVTQTTAGEVTLRYRGILTQVSARSLGGRHEVEVS